MFQKNLPKKFSELDEYVDDNKIDTSSDFCLQILEVIWVMMSYDADSPSFKYKASLIGHTMEQNMA